MNYFLTILILTVFFSDSNAQKKAVLPEKKMLRIPGGNYKPFYVTKDNKPIKVAPFLMDETAVTNMEFLEFVKANPQWRRSRINSFLADSNYLRHWESDLSIGQANKNICNSPVVNVSWFAARAYCKWKNKRLPDVAEWEYAGSAAPLNLKGLSLTEYILGWYNKPNLPVLPNIRSTYRNIFGLYDMHGLVWEWTFDFNSFISSGDSGGNTEDGLKAVCASGSVNVRDKTDYAAFLRFSYRGSLRGRFCIANLGFRCARSITK